jgi:hypothetical protein
MLVKRQVMVEGILGDTSDVASVSPSLNAFRVLPAALLASVADQGDGLLDDPVAKFE